MYCIDVILPLAIRGTYTYRVPESVPYPHSGMRVLVPLGNKQLIGIVMAEHRINDVSEDKLRDVLMVLDSIPIVTQEQLQLWLWIASYYMCPIGEVMVAALPSKALDRQYVLSDTPSKRIKLPVYSDIVEPISKLDSRQQIALEQLHGAWHKNPIILLHGVTSSGKTEVYIHLIKEQLQQGKQVLYLVPEIALTTQLTNRLQGVFGNQLYVYHSRVSDGQRMELYRQLLMNNDAKLVVGARSAIFLPMNKLGLVIVDEEHEPSYKQQDPAPRYHARSVAIVMAKRLKANVLLGTATPSVETYYNALEGKYGLVEMKERYAGLQLPSIQRIDLEKQYHRKEMYGHLADPLVARIGEELSKGKQIILFQNRRGYAPYIQCTKCGTVSKCDDCDVSLTLHLQAKELVCHYCGKTFPLPPLCPVCGGGMQIHGFGTERLEDEVKALFPSARVARMDLDTTRKKDSYRLIIDQFARHEVDILIGTQMVSKGLHFDDVSLVAVLNADMLFNQPSFRCYERAYQMLEQVSGRAGRKGTQGEVFLQTFSPKHPVLYWVKEHSYESMYRHEIAERRTFGFPPFFRLMEITIRHTNPQKVIAAATILHQRLVQIFAHRCSPILVPAIARVHTYTLRMLRLRIETNASIQQAKSLLSEAIAYTEMHESCKGVQCLVDVDPNN